MNSADWIVVHRAREHHLQNVSARFPIGAFSVVTGVSGSGKSSLVFDTLFAEGAARFAEALWLGRYRADGQPRPAVDRIEGLPPVIGLSQTFRPRRRRQRLADFAELGPLVDTLFAGAGVLYCPACAVPVRAQSRQAIVTAVLRAGERTKIMILAPVVRQETGSHAEVFQRIAKSGYVRARVNGVLIDLTTLPVLDPRQHHSIEAVVDRLIIKEGIAARLEESLDAALTLGTGNCVVSVEQAGAWHDTLWSTQLACPQCQRSFPPIDRRSFQPQHPLGACATCRGQAVVQEGPCPTCSGSGLGEVGRHVRLGETSWPEWIRLTVAQGLPQLEAWSQACSHSDDASVRHLAESILPETRERLQCLIAAGLGYLGLAREDATLSLGEWQRVRLAAALGGRVSDAAFLLDEPTAGLHPTDTARILDLLRGLTDAGNTVIAVEHDLDVIQQADWIVELGPGAGPRGGNVVTSGPPAEALATGESVTGQLLQSTVRAAAPVPSSPTDWLQAGPFHVHNLQGLTVRLPWQRLVGICGVSGSGKSTLMHAALLPALQQQLTGRTPNPLVQLDHPALVRQVVAVAPPGSGRSPWSTTATIGDVWNEIARLLARTREAKRRGFPAERFRWRNSPGSCRRCLGRGQIPADETFVTALPRPCPACRGRRFDRATLAVTWHGRSAADLLELSIDAAAELFAPIARIGRRLAAFQILGLGYLTLGQPGATLSGGERQRLTLGSQLARTEQEPTLFVFDEPTIGLHGMEVAALLTGFRALCAAGHSVVVIEHHSQLLRACDWLIELGPGAGPAGGQLIAAGPPEEVSQLRTPTASCLRSE